MCVCVLSIVNQPPFLFFPQWVSHLQMMEKYSFVFMDRYAQSHKLIYTYLWNCFAIPMASNIYRQNKYEFLMRIERSNHPAAQKPCNLGVLVFSFKSYGICFTSHVRFFLKTSRIPFGRKPEYFFVTSVAWLANPSHCQIPGAKLPCM